MLAESTGAEVGADAAAPPATRCVPTCSLFFTMVVATNSLTGSPVELQMGLERPRGWEQRWASTRQFIGNEEHARPLPFLHTGGSNHAGDGHVGWVSGGAAGGADVGHATCLTLTGCLDWSMASISGAGCVGGGEGGGLAAWATPRSRGAGRGRGKCPSHQNRKGCRGVVFSSVPKPRI
jgi:hypothetical protein